MSYSAQGGLQANMPAALGQHAHSGPTWPDVRMTAPREATAEAPQKTLWVWLKGVGGSAGGWGCSSVLVYLRTVTATQAVTNRLMGMPAASTTPTRPSSEPAAAPG